MRLMLRTDKAPASYSQAHASGSTGWKVVLARHMFRSAQGYALDRVMLVIGQVLVLTLHGIIGTAWQGQKLPRTKANASLEAGRTDGGDWERGSAKATRLSLGASESRGSLARTARPADAQDECNCKPRSKTNRWGRLRTRECKGNTTVTRCPGKQGRIARTARPEDAEDECKCKPRSRTDRWGRLRTSEATDSEGGLVPRTAGGNASSAVFPIFPTYPITMRPEAWGGLSHSVERGPRLQRTMRPEACGGLSHPVERGPRLQRLMPGPPGRQPSCCGVAI